MHPESSFAPDVERLKESKNFLVSQKLKARMEVLPHVSLLVRESQLGLSN